MRDWQLARLSSQDTLLSALELINRNRLGIALVVDKEDKLLGTIVDGDIRRAVLRGVSVKNFVEEAMNKKPVTAEAQQPAEAYLHLMISHEIQQLPLVETAGKLLGLILLKDLQTELTGGLKAVIMAGGLGVRLRPETERVPKPMLPVGDRPIMDHVLKRLRDSGIHEVLVSTHYKENMIREYLGDGSSFGVEIRYVNEEQRFGTIGGLRLMRQQLKEPFLVINGDILTTLDFSAMRMFHYQHQADMTIAVREHNLEVPYGVVRVEGEMVTGLEEKPMVPLLINAGIYLIDPSVIDYIPEGQYFDATNLIAKLIQEKCHLVPFPVLEYWIDIGQPVDYEQANADARQGQLLERPESIP